MAEIGNLGGELRRIATFFNGLVQAADVFDQIQSLESGVAAAEQRRQEAENAAAHAGADLADATTALNVLRDKAAKLLADTNDTATRTLTDAKEQAEVIRGQAENAAADTRAAMAKVVGQMRIDIDQERDAAQAELSSIKDQIDVAQKANEELTAQAEALEGRIAAAQAQIAKLLTGS